MGIDKENQYAFLNVYCKKAICYSNKKISVFFWPLDLYFSKDFNVKYGTKTVVV